MSMNVMLLGAGGAADVQIDGGAGTPFIDLGLTTGLTLDIQSFNSVSSSTSTGVVTNLAPFQAGSGGGPASGIWTTSQNDSPSTVGPNMTNLTRDGVTFQTWNFTGGNTPAGGWIRFDANNVAHFASGATPFSAMWWVAHDDAASDWCLGGSDGTPTWQGHNSATAAINCHRNQQWEYLGHSFDHKFSYGSVTATGGDHANANSEWVNYFYCCNNNGWTLYRNGVEMGSTSYNGKNTANTNYFIGRGWSKSDVPGVDGKMSWAAYWRNRVLTGAECRSIYAATRAFHGVDHSSFIFHIPQSSTNNNWIGISEMKLVNDQGFECLAQLTYDTQARGRTIVECAPGGINSMSTYNPAQDPRGTSDHWNNNSGVEMQFAMRVPYAGNNGIASKSNINYFEVGYHTSYVNPAQNITLTFDGHDLTFTQQTVNTVNSHWIVRYDLSGN
tara:strand:- start:65 stop:1393 length:1329 start_codon:yes stop_codon:yes gene_type:complete